MLELGIRSLTLLRSELTRSSELPRSLRCAVLRWAYLAASRSSLARDGSRSRDRPRQGRVSRHSPSARPPADIRQRCILLDCLCLPCALHALSTAQLSSAWRNRLALKTRKVAEAAQTSGDAPDNPTTKSPIIVCSRGSSQGGAGNHLRRCLVLVTTQRSAMEPSCFKGIQDFWLEASITVAPIEKNLVPLGDRWSCVVRCMAFAVPQPLRSSTCFPRAQANLEVVPAGRCNLIGPHILWQGLGDSRSGNWFGGVQGATRGNASFHPAAAAAAARQWLSGRLTGTTVMAGEGSARVAPGRRLGVSAGPSACKTSCLLRS